MVHDLDSKGSVHQMVEGNNCVLGHMPLMHYKIEVLREYYYIKISGPCSTWVLKVILNENWGFCGGDREDCCLLGCATMQFDRKVPVFNICVSVLCDKKWRLSQQVCQKHWYFSIKLQGVTSQNALSFSME